MSDDRLLPFPPVPEAPTAPEAPDAPPWASDAEPAPAPPAPPAPPTPMRSARFTKASIELDAPTPSAETPSLDELDLDIDAPTSDDPVLATEPPRPDVDTPALLRRRRVSGDAKVSGRVVPFRRRGGDRRIRRLRRHPLVRWVGPLAIAVVWVAVPVLAVAWLVLSPRFALAEVQVHPDPETVGASRVDIAWVEAALAPMLGESVWTLPLDEIDARLKHHPWIDAIGLVKSPPTTLEVHLIERRQAALWRDGDTIVTVDAEGRPIAPFDAADGHGADLALITGDADDLAAAIDFLDHLEAIAPSWLAGLSEVEALGDADFRVHTSDLPFPLLLRQHTTPSLESKCRYLQALLPRIVERFQAIDAVDLRFARRIIVEPSGTAPRDVA